MGTILNFHRHVNCAPSTDWGHFLPYTKAVSSVSGDGFELAYVFSP